jgi:hypothetical protein
VKPPWESRMWLGIWAKGLCGWNWSWRIEVGPYAAGVTLDFTRGVILRKSWDGS